MRKNVVETLVNTTPSNPFTVLVKLVVSLRFFLMALLFLPTIAQAAPWVSADDARLRSAVEWLADRGCLTSPITTWPLMWADVQLATDAPTACSQSLAWQYTQYERRWAMQPATAGLRVASANQSPVFRHFDSLPREEESVGLRLALHSDHWALGLSPQYVPNPHGLDNSIKKNQYRYDGSYLAASYGNWVLGVGAINRWWGPGWQSSLILGSNSRPVPAVFVSRRQAKRIDFPVLRWLGPWTVKAFAGQLESNRAVPRAKLIGMRFAFKPAQWLELGLSRTLQWGGEGRSQSGSNLWNALIGHDNYHQASKKEPGNQLGGVDFRLGFGLGQTTTLRLYGQLVGEDEAGGLPSRNIYQAGVGLSGAWLLGRQQVGVEFTDTTVDDFTDALPNVAYEHHIYHNGYRYYGRPLGATWDNDSKIVSFSLKQFFTSNKSLALTISRLALNEDGTLPASSGYSPLPVALVSELVSTESYQLTYSQTLFDGRLSLSVRHLADPLVTLADHYDQTTIMASWEYRFAL